LFTPGQHAGDHKAAATQYDLPVKATFHHADSIMDHEQNSNGFVDDASLIMNVPVLDNVDTAT
jgi:hypothetical protein